MIWLLISFVFAIWVWYKNLAYDYYYDIISTIIISTIIMSTVIISSIIISTIIISSIIISILLSLLSLWVGLPNGRQ